MIKIPELESLTAEIHIEREKNSIKAYELAKRSGISKSAMSKLENNNLEPSYKLVYRVIKALNELAEFKGSRNTVKEKMIKNPISVSPDESIANARKIMKKKDISQIPVIDKNGSILGIITEKSILDNQNGIKCSDSMEFNYTILEPDSDLERAREIIRNTQVILVVEDRKLVGLLTKADFL